MKKQQKQQKPLTNTEIIEWIRVIITFLIGTTVVSVVWDYWNVVLVCFSIIVVLRIIQQHLIADTKQVLETQRLKAKLRLEREHADMEQRHSELLAEQLKIFKQHSQEIQSDKKK